MDEYTTEYDKPSEAKVALTMSRPTAARLQTLAFEKLILAGREDQAGKREPLPDPATALSMIVVDWAKRVLHGRGGGVK